MSECAPDGVYVYQPHPVSRLDGRLWQVSGWPDGMTREHATAIADAANRILSGATSGIDQALLRMARLEQVIQVFATRPLPGLSPCWCEQITIGDEGQVEHDARCRAVTDALRPVRRGKARNERRASEEDSSHAG